MSKQMTLNDFRNMDRLSNEIAVALAPKLETLKALQEKAITAKNAADEGNTVKNGENGIWANVFDVTRIVEEATKDTPEYRHDLLTDALKDFLIPKLDDAGKPLKLSTVGSYASTARKLLVEVVTKQGKPLSSFAGKSYAEVRAEFKSAAHAALLETVKNMGEQLRFVVKNGTPEAHREVVDMAELVKALYNPIKAAKDAKSSKGKASIAVPELQQQAPAEAGTLETAIGEAEVAADALHDAVGDEQGDEEQKQAVGQ